jgi:predicted lipoprotein with Yx(FWY)xxD motif
MKHQLLAIKTGAVLLLLAAGFFFAGSNVQAASVPPGIEFYKPGTHVGEFITIGNNVYQVNEDGTLTLVRGNKVLKNLLDENLSRADLRKLLDKYPYLYDYYYYGFPNNNVPYAYVPGNGVPYYYPYGYAPTPVPTTANAVPVTGGGPLTVTVTNTATLGNFLIGYKGMTLYTYALDTAGVSTCTGACATNWPAAIVTGVLTPGSGITDTTKLSTYKRSDGRSQVTYNGKPLYYFTGDKKAGDTFGQGVGGVWYVVNP